MLKRSLLGYALAISAVAVSRSAFANVGLPLVAVFLPPLWIALLPIILIEGAIAARNLGISAKRSLAAYAVGNVVSTIVGVPLLWVVLATVELTFFGTARGLSSFGSKLYAVTVQAPWLIPYEPHFGWMVPAALVTMAMLCLALSVIVESPIVARILRDVPRRSVWRHTTIVNVASYVVLGAFG